MSQRSRFCRNPKTQNGHEKFEFQILNLNDDSKNEGHRHSMEELAHNHAHAQDNAHKLRHEKGKFY